MSRRKTGGASWIDELDLVDHVSEHANPFGLETRTPIVAQGPNPFDPEPEVTITLYGREPRSVVREVRIENTDNPFDDETTLAQRWYRR